MRMDARRTTKAIVRTIGEESGEADGAFCRSPKGRPRFGRSTLSQPRLCTRGTRRLSLRVSHPETRPSQLRAASSEVPQSLHAKVERASTRPLGIWRSILVRV